jgi:sec-independent protein translocase protein TatB
MFDFAWSEIALIGVVALIAIGPKDMPGAIRAVTTMIKKARRMAGEFQTHVDEMLREADLHEVRKQIDELRNFDIKGEIEKAVDADGTIRATFAENPLEAAINAPLTEPAPAETATLEAPAEAPTETEPTAEAEAAAPAFIPPEIANRPEPPAFIPPGYARS